MMSEAWHEQSSPVSRYGACFWHSAHASCIVACVLCLCAILVVCREFLGRIIFEG